MTDPSRFSFPQVHSGVLAKTHVAILAAGAMSPRADDHPGFAPCLFAAALGAHSREAVDRAGQENIEPSALRVRRNSDPAELFFVTDLFPIVVVTLMHQPIPIMTHGVACGLQV